MANAIQQAGKSHTTTRSQGEGGGAVPYLHLSLKVHNLYLVASTQLRAVHNSNRANHLSALIQVHVKECEGVVWWLPKATTAHHVAVVASQASCTRWASAVIIEQPHVVWSLWHVPFPRQA